MSAAPPRWDIFCRIIDNFGDVGVSWRLARQLTHEHGLSVRLWLDDPARARRLLPALIPERAQQTIEGVTIRHWQDAFCVDTVADVVTEAFGCELPPGYVQAMVAKPPVWLNLEYLSAERWVADYHLQPSPHPRLPLTRTFFFPGFGARTGGLLRERDLPARRARWQRGDAQANLRQRYGGSADMLTLSLFCYPQAPLEALLRILAEAPQPVQCFIPDGARIDAVRAFFGAPALRAGDCRQRGNLRVHALPFLSQTAYDELLWSCDLNFVRGEDSWIRALWAARPFIWQPYRQQEDVHLVKLDAFLDRYQRGLAADARGVLRRFHHGWSAAELTRADWQALTACLPQLRAHAAGRSRNFARQPDLARQLVAFCGSFSPK